jgi:hypothetical protein
MKKNNKKIIFGFLSILFIIQIFFFSELNKSSVKYENLNNNIRETEFDQQYILLNSIIRKEQKNTLNAIKQSWINYSTTENKKLVQTDYDGKYPIYSNDIDYVYYNSDTMNKTFLSDNYYNIYNKNGDLLLSNCKPLWNKDELNKLLNYIVAPIKCYGNNGGVIVYDSYSGEIFLDTTNINRHVGSNIFLDYENVNCKNMAQTKKDINSFLRVKKDSTLTEENFIYSFNEVEDLKNPNNFIEYPLGDYNRLFVEKMILPYESFGFEGQPMQLTVLILADENDIYSCFKDNSQKSKTLIEESEMLNNKTIFILITTIVITMIYLLLIAYILKYGSYLFNSKE